jgi:PAS domain S-box-containing protein
MMRDGDGRIVTSNRSASRILGLSAEAILKGTAERPPLSFIHEDGSPVLASEQPTVVSIRTGEPQTGVIMGFINDDGSIRWISVNSSPLAGSGERPYAAVASFTDITEFRNTLLELQTARRDDLKRLALVGEYREDDTNQHTERVAHTAELLAVKLGLDSDLTVTIHTAAALHDLGKIGIPDRILLKPGRLTAEEFELMKTHTAIGGRILGESDVPTLKMATEIALSHHEQERHRLPIQIAGRGDPPDRTDHRGRGCVRRHDPRPSIQGRVLGRARHRRDPALPWHTV